MIVPDLAFSELDFLNAPRRAPQPAERSASPSSFSSEEPPVSRPLKKKKSKGRGSSLSISSLEDDHGGDTNGELTGITMGKRKELRPKSDWDMRFGPAPGRYFTLGYWRAIFEIVGRRIRTWFRD